MKIMRISMEIKRSAESGFCAASQSKLALSIAELLTEVPEHPDQKGNGESGWNDNANFGKNAVHRETPALSGAAQETSAGRSRWKTLHLQKKPNSISAS
jgi:hypothetical protein